MFYAFLTFMTLIFQYRKMIGRQMPTKSWTCWAQILRPENAALLTSLQSMSVPKSTCKQYWIQLNVLSKFKYIFLQCKYGS